MSDNNTDIAKIRTEFSIIKDVLGKLSKVNSMTLNALNVHNMDRATRDRINETLLLHETIKPDTEHNGNIWQQYVTYSTPVADITTWSNKPAHWTPHGGDVTFKYTVPVSDCIIDSFELTRKNIPSQFGTLDSSLKLNFKNRDSRFGTWSYHFEQVGLNNPNYTDGHGRDDNSVDRDSFTIDIPGVLDADNFATDSIGTLPFLIRSTYEIVDITLRVQDNNINGDDLGIYLFRIHSKYTVSNTVYEETTNNPANIPYYHVRGIKSFYSDNVLTTKYKDGQESSFYLNADVTGPSSV